MTDNTFSGFPRKINNTFSRRTGLILTGLGMAVFIIGAKPDWFGLNISESIGFAQIGVFSLGLVLLCIGATLALRSLWPPHWRSISADIGLRLAWSGLVLALISGMADILGLGTRPFYSSFTFFGHWQARGVMAGEILMFIGFFMMIPLKTDFPPPPEDTAEEAGEKDSGNELPDKDQNPPEPAEENKPKIKIEFD